MSKKGKDRRTLAKKAVSIMMTTDQSCLAAESIAALYQEMKYETGAGVESGIDVKTVTDVISAQQVLLDKGDLSSLEAMLYGNAHILNVMTSTFIQKMSKAEYIDNLEVYGRLALKSQNQLRQTISTLAEIKGIKRTTFISQVNQAENQQINNSKTENLLKSANERVISNVDTRSKRGGTQENSEDEALALSENPRGASTIGPECSQARYEISKVEGAGEADSATCKTGARGK